MRHDDVSHPHVQAVQTFAKAVSALLEQLRKACTEDFFSFIIHSFIHSLSFSLSPSFFTCLACFCTSLKLCPHLYRLQSLLLFAAKRTPFEARLSVRSAVVFLSFL